MQHHDVVAGDGAGRFRAVQRRVGVGSWATGIGKRRPGSPIRTRTAEPPNRDLMRMVFSLWVGFTSTLTALGELREPRHAGYAMCVRILGGSTLAAEVKCPIYERAIVAR